MPSNWIYLRQEIEDRGSIRAACILLETVTSVDVKDHIGALKILESNLSIEITERVRRWDRKDEQS